MISVAWKRFKDWSSGRPQPAALLEQRHESAERAAALQAENIRLKSENQWLRDMLDQALVNERFAMQTMVNTSYHGQHGFFPFQGAAHAPARPAGERPTAADSPAYVSASHIAQRERAEFIAEVDAFVNQKRG